jgi:DNA-directed RNA polymerase
MIAFDRGVRPSKSDGQLADEMQRWWLAHHQQRKPHRDREVWRALKGVNDETIAIRLLIAGISVSELNKLGADDDGKKNLRDQAIFIGRNLGQRRDLGLKVGAWGINMLTSLPVFALDEDDVLRMTAAADDIMDDVIDRAVASNPLLSPLAEPPVPWTQARKGGLPADHWANVPLIRDRHPSIENAARKAIGTGAMKRVLDAINALQRVPFAINEPMRDFILRDGKPSSPEGPRPPVWQQERRQKWDEALARLTAFHTDMVIAEAMASAGRFWVPLNIDFRGRVYGIPHFNFQREDRVRALFLFADGEPIGDSGLGWLKQHVAGTANGNKWSAIRKPGALHTAGRLKWTEDNLEKLCEIGRAVLRRDEPKTLAWAMPKEKYQFLAACVELVQAVEKGPKFETRLPIVLDGTNSGLQHIAAMTRAEVEGGYVNLRPADEPSDFYSLVAHRVWEAAPDLRHLMQGQDDRDLMKRPTMSFFYGSRAGGFRRNTNEEIADLAVEKPRLAHAVVNGTATKEQMAEWNGRPRAVGMVKQIIETLKERRHNQIDNAEVKQLARVIHKSIGEMAPRATEVLKFLRRLAWLYAKEGKPLRWPTADGLPVINCYHKPIVKPVEVSLRGPSGRKRRFNFVVGEESDVWKEKAANSAAANFVHSVDATHLRFVALAAAGSPIVGATLPIPSFDLVTVHDCFGCIAPRAPFLRYILLDQLSHLHTACSLLSWLLEAAKRDLPRGTKLPKLPEPGNLDLSEFRDCYDAFK